MLDTHMYNINNNIIYYFRYLNSFIHYFGVAKLKRAGGPKILAPTSSSTCTHQRTHVEMWRCALAERVRAAPLAPGASNYQNHSPLKHCNRAPIGLCGHTDGNKMSRMTNALVVVPLRSSFASPKLLMSRCCRRCSACSAPPCLSSCSLKPVYLPFASHTIAAN